jgi:L-alanine-DL-glutamate epimerase-like enolase superfamily enzyme
MSDGAAEVVRALSAGGLRHAMVPLELTLPTPLLTAFGRLTGRRGWAITLTGPGGSAGVAECLPLPEWGTEGHDEAHAALRGWCLEHRAPGPATPAARAAVATATELLACVLLGQPLWRWLRGTPGGPPRVASHRLVAGETPDAVAARAVEALAEGYRVVKLKASADIAVVRGCVEAIRGVAPTAGIRLDANGSWSESLALEQVGWLRRHGVTLVEQPVPALDLDALTRLSHAEPDLFAADEALLVAEAPERLLRMAPGSTWVLKPAVMGGPRATCNLALRAAEQGIASLVTTFVDGAVGRATAAHVAAAVPGGEQATHGLATGRLVAADAPGWPDLASRLLGETPGLGEGLDTRPGPA